MQARLFAAVFLSQSALLLISIAAGVPACASNPRAEALYKSACGHKEAFATRQTALKEIDQALAIDPKNSSYLSMKGYIVLGTSEDGSAEALHYANEALKYNAKNADAWDIKARYYETKKDFPSALKCADEAVKSGSNPWLYRTMRAEILLHAGQKDAAKKELDECLKLTNSNPSTLSVRAIIAEDEHDWPMSIKLRTRLIEMTNKTSVSIDEHYMKRSRSYEMLKDYDKAIADLNAAAKVTTFNHGAHYQLLRLYKLKNDTAGIARETRVIKELEEDMRPL